MTEPFQPKDPVWNEDGAKTGRVPRMPAPPPPPPAAQKPKS